MAGINRLGKGPAKPGTMRPADPNKYKTTDIFSEGTEGDKDFQRMVQDIEDTQQNHSGWLFGRGAFDKGDLLYLRDEEEKKRYEEQEMREAETRAFNQNRQRVMALQDDSLPATNPAYLEKLKEKMTHAEALKSRIKVKPPSKVKLKSEPGVRVKQEGPPEKKIKTENGVSVKKEEDPGWPSPLSAQRPVKQEAPVQNAPPVPVKSEPSEEDDGGEGGLGALLGDYGSDSESEGAEQQAVEALPLPDFLQPAPVTKKPP